MRIVIVKGTLQHKCSEASKDAEDRGKVWQILSRLRKPFQKFGDGKPCICGNFLAEEQHVWHVAGFHTALNTINGWGSLFRDSVLWTVLKFGNRDFDVHVNW
mmetsp:Transcript_28957/g.45400  ORF Transcript_28957/g.45400 Transcript_28957/m.45400 type:complete len:102 (+) Transcript_28957:65-370(+)